MITIIKRIWAFLRALFSHRDDRLSAPPSYIPRLFKLSVGEIISITPGKRHAWFQSNIGPIRKPIAKDFYFAYKTAV